MDVENVGRTDRGAWWILRVGLMVGVPLGLLAGILRGSRFAAAGFPFAGVIELKNTLNEVVLLTAGFLLIYQGVCWIAGRGPVSSRLAHVVACATACLPLFLAIGYSVNLDRQISPSTLFTRRGLTINLGLAIVLLALFPLIAFLIRHWATRPRRPGRGLWVVVFVSLISVLAGANAAGYLPMKADGAARATPNVILIVVDSLRADHLGVYGYKRATSPRIDAFAHDAILFDQAISQGTDTKTSIASLLTSKLPYQHGVYRITRAEQYKRAMSDTLAGHETTVAEMLQSRGFLTSAWVRSTELRPQWGFAQGFVTYEPNQRSADTINWSFISRLRQVGSRYRFFAYLHYLDVHYPYRPQPPYERMFAAVPEARSASWQERLQNLQGWSRDIRPDELEDVRALYDGAVRQMDEALGHALDALKEEGLYDNSLIVLTSAHGEGFMEHGFLAHANIPYDELVRVPLIVKMPGSRFRGTRIDRQVRHVDVLPTILDVVRIAEPSTLEGCSLLALLDDKAAASNPRPGCFSYALTENADENGRDVIAVRTDRYKYIRQPDGRAEFYELAADPREHSNRVAGGDPIVPVLGRLASEIDKRRVLMRYRHLLDAGTLRDLKALGEDR